MNGKTVFLLHNDIEKSFTVKFLLFLWVEESNHILNRRRRHTEQQTTGKWNSPHWMCSVCSAIPGGFSVQSTPATEGHSTVISKADVLPHGGLIIQLEVHIQKSRDHFQIFISIFFNPKNTKIHRLPFTHYSRTISSLGFDGITTRLLRECVKVTWPLWASVLSLLMWR